MKDSIYNILEDWKVLVGAQPEFKPDEEDEYNPDYEDDEKESRLEYAAERDLERMAE